MIYLVDKLTAKGFDKLGIVCAIPVKLSFGIKKKYYRFLYLEQFEDSVGWT